MDIEHLTLGFTSNSKLKMKVDKQEEKDLVLHEIDLIINVNELQTRILRNLNWIKLEFKFCTGVIIKGIKHSCGETNAL